LGSKNGQAIFLALRALLATLYSRCVPDSDSDEGRRRAAYRMG